MYVFVSVLFSLILTALYIINSGSLFFVCFTMSVAGIMGMDIRELCLSSMTLTS